MAQLVSLAILLLFALLSSFTKLAISGDTAKNALASEPPSTESGSPVAVNVSLFVVSLSQLQQSTSGSFRAQIYFRQRWVDPRLSKASLSKTGNSENGVHFIDSLSGYHSRNGQILNLKGKEQLEQIWTPDTFVPNVRSMAHQMLVGSGQQEAEFCKIDKRTGEVFISKMLDLTAGCFMDLSSFPFDTQRCSIEFESYGFSAADIQYQWMEPKKKAVGFVSGLQVDGFSLADYDVSSVTERLSTGNYSRVVVEFELERKVSRYLVTAYLPTLLLVALTWIPMNKIGKGVFASRMLFLAVLLVSYCLIATAHWCSVPFTSGSLTSADHFLLLSLLLLVLAFVNAARRQCLLLRAYSSAGLLPSYGDAVKIEMKKDGDGKETSEAKDAEKMLFAGRQIQVLGNFFLPLSALIVYGCHFAQLFF